MPTNRLYLRAALNVVIVTAVVLLNQRISLADEPPPTLAPGQTLTIVKIDMFTSTEGWAIGGTPDDTDFLLHSEDGGKSWKDVTPPDMLESEFRRIMTPPYFLNSSVAWIVQNDGAKLWNTRDGGKTWSSVAMPQPHSSSAVVHFLNEQRGWVLVLDCCAASNEGAGLFTTSNAGNTWTVINDDGNMNPVHEGINHDLSSVYHTGMIFFGSQTGWMTLASFATDVGGLIMTKDGGVSWQGVKMPLPDGVAFYEYKGLRSPKCGYFRPTVFAKNIVTVLAMCRVAKDAADTTPTGYLFHSEDMGVTWTTQPIPYLTGAIMTSSQPEFPMQLLSPLQLWIALDNHLYQTQDGGKTWSILLELPQDQHITAFDFVEPKIGWISAYDETGTYQLQKTSDGGQTWQSLDPHVAYD